MSILQTIKSDLISALKNRDAETVSVLRLIDSAVKNKEIGKRTLLARLGASKMTQIKDVAELEKQSRLSEEEIIELLMSETKKRKEAIEQFRKGGRNDLAEKEEKEIAILQKYLPTQLTAEEIRQEAKRVIAETKPIGPSDFGKTMGILASRLKGRAEGKIVAEILKKELEII